MKADQVSKLSPLARLTKLKILDLMGGSRISLHYGLRVLTVQANQVSDLAPLASLVNLEELNLIDNRINNVAPLADLTNLRNLYLDGNRISDISGLVPLAQAGGLGGGSFVDLRCNYLDVTPGSQNVDDIQTLIKNGVNVAYEPQR